MRQSLQSSLGAFGTMTSRQPLPSTGFSLDRKLSSWDNIEVSRERKKTHKPQVDDVDVESAVQAAGIKDDDWVQKLLDVEEEQQLILIISYLMNERNIDNKTIKSARTELPSFSTEAWSNFAAQAGLPDDPSYLKLGYFKTPVYQLPPSFHNAIFENS